MYITKEIQYLYLRFSIVYLYSIYYTKYKANEKELWDNSCDVKIY